MEYLLYLQQLREAAPGIVNEGILFLSEFMGGTGALAVIALVYWCISKCAGSFMLLNFYHRVGRLEYRAEANKMAENPA